MNLIVYDLVINKLRSILPKGGNCSYCHGQCNTKSNNPTCVMLLKGAKVRFSDICAK